MNRFTWCVVAACAVATLCESNTFAQIWQEQGDAGDVPTIAQIPDGRGGLSLIEGQYQSGSDADMFLIHIDDPNVFRASTVGLAFVDTQLFLFDENGFGITHNDDDPTGFSLQSVITGRFVPGAGLYYIATAQYDRDPYSAEGEMWQDLPYEQERRPDGPGNAAAVNSWQGSSFGDGAYGIELAGASFPIQGPSLDVSGSCPGEIIANIDGLTPGGAVALIATLGGGQLTIPPGRPCAGVVLELNPLGNPQLLTGRADGEGVAILQARMPGAACGRMVAQALDLATCVASNATAF